MIEMTMGYRARCDQCGDTGKLCEFERDALHWAVIRGWKPVASSSVLCPSCWMIENADKNKIPLADLGGES
mgnify:CR=1 FL=1